MSKNTKYLHGIPNSKVHGANMGPIWGQQDPGRPHVGPMNFAIWVVSARYYYFHQWQKKFVSALLMVCHFTDWFTNNNHVHNINFQLPFYTPLWKTGRIMPWQCPSIRLSVCPSVRPCFPDFSSTCFEISIWNLVYTFSRWHDMLSLTCITIGSFWPSLQPKVGQTHFLQSWPHKSR